MFFCKCFVISSFHWKTFPHLWHCTALNLFSIWIITWIQLPSATHMRVESQSMWIFTEKNIYNKQCIVGCVVNISRKRKIIKHLQKWRYLVDQPSWWQAVCSTTSITTRSHMNQYQPKAWTGGTGVRSGSLLRELNGRGHPHTGCLKKQHIWIDNSCSDESIALPYNKYIFHRKLRKLHFLRTYLDTYQFANRQIETVSYK